MPEIILLALGSMFWPTLLVVVLIALRSDRPGRILFAFYLGGMLTTVVIGSIAVLALEGSPVIEESGHNRLPSAPWIYLTLGTIAVTLGWTLRRYEAEISARRRARKERKGPSKTTARLEGIMARGGLLAFLAGVALSAMPGPLALIAFADIAQLDYSPVGTVLIVILFYLVMFAFLEVPIVSYLLRPEATAARVTAFNSWLNTHALSIAAWVLIAIGAVEIARGVIHAA